MIPYSYKIMKRHVCADCGQEFESGSPTALYCTTTCQRKAKAKRRSLRGVKAQVELNPNEQLFYANVTNPSIDTLSTYATKILNNETGDMPVKFTGLVPMWQPPNGIQFRLILDAWVMDREDIITALMRK